MKLTKLHIFIIILIALILCPTLGACSVQEGYVNVYQDTSTTTLTEPNEMTNTYYQNNKGNTPSSGGSGGGSGGGGGSGSDNKHKQFSWLKSLF